MCVYGITRAVYVTCRQNPGHQSETRVVSRCEASLKAKSACREPEHVQALDMLPSQKGGPCPFCRDSGMVMEVPKIKWVSVYPFMEVIYAVVLTAQ